MTTESLKREIAYQFHCDIAKNTPLKIANTTYFDEWGCAWVSYGKTMGVEYNLCIDSIAAETINYSAIYKVYYNERNNTYETDGCEFVSYKINFDNPNWMEELENAMCEALIKFFGL